MTRYDYAPARLVRLRAALSEVLHDPPVRASIATLGAALALAASAIAVELHRLADVDAAVTALDARVAHAGAARNRLALAHGELSRLRRLDDGVAAARARAREEVNALVLLGNRLPLDAELTRMHGDRGGSWTIDGRAPRMSAVGSALIEATRSRPGAHVRLLSVGTGSPRARGLRFSLSLERPAERPAP